MKKPKRCTMIGCQTPQFKGARRWRVWSYGMHWDHRTREAAERRIANFPTHLREAAEAQPVEPDEPEPAEQPSSQPTTRQGRPLTGETRRVAISATIASSTDQKIQSAREIHESTGRCLDRLVALAFEKGEPVRAFADWSGGMVRVWRVDKASGRAQLAHQGIGSEQDAEQITKAPTFDQAIATAKDILA
jgi:hypothetical protein